MNSSVDCNQSSEKRGGLSLPKREDQGRCKRLESRNSLYRVVLVTMPWVNSHVSLEATASRASCFPLPILSDLVRTPESKQRISKGDDLHNRCCRHICQMPRLAD